MSYPWSARQQLVVAGIVVDERASPTVLAARHHPPTVLGEQVASWTVLAARRHSPPELAGRWELPGGKVEPGESPEAAVVRELTEELAVTVVVGSELVNPTGHTWPISPTLTLRVWWCHLVDGAPTAGETHDRAEWFAPTDLGALDWLDADRPIVSELLRAGPGGTGW